MNEIPANTAPHPESHGPVPVWLEWRGSGEVLVVDDDDAVRLVMSRALSKIGFTVTMASSGREALTLIDANAERYVTVLLDYKLPGIDSMTVLRVLRSKREDVPVILMSGYNKQQAMAESKGLGLAGFLPKPFTVDTLAQTMRSVLCVSSAATAGKAG